jgi:hypothetical protein
MEVAAAFSAAGTIKGYMSSVKGRFAIILGLLAQISAGAEALQRLTFQTPPKVGAIAGVWSLGHENITTEITDAYRYHDKIVTFGWAGNFNGVVTIIDATTGKEKLELLVNERSRLITPSGALIYSHWFVKGAYEPDDSVWMLDLNRPLAAATSHLAGGVTEEIGVKSTLPPRTQR